jgi:uncharacterized protein YndB with AHSA1/START domain
MALQVTTPNDLDIVVTRAFNAPRKLVWQAWTTPAYIRRWMLGPSGWEMPVCDVDMRVGGKYRYVWRKDGHEMGMGGTFKEVRAPEMNAATQLFDGGIMGQEQIVTLRLTETAGRTLSTTTITHKSKAERDAALQTGMERGMEAGYERLDAILGEMA